MTDNTFTSKAVAGLHGRFYFPQSTPPRHASNSLFGQTLPVMRTVHDDEEQFVADVHDPVDEVGAYSTQAHSDEVTIMPDTHPETTEQRSTSDMTNNAMRFSIVLDSTSQPTTSEPSSRPDVSVTESMKDTAVPSTEFHNPYFKATHESRPADWTEPRAPSFSPITSPGQASHVVDDTNGISVPTIAEVDSSAGPKRKRSTYTHKPIVRRTALSIPEQVQDTENDEADLDALSRGAFNRLNVRSFSPALVPRVTKARDKRTPAKKIKKTRAEWLEPTDGYKTRIGKLSLDAWKNISDRILVLNEPVKPERKVPYRLDIEVRKIHILTVGRGKITCPPQNRTMKGNVTKDLNTAAPQNLFLVCRTLRDIGIKSYYEDNTFSFSDEGEFTRWMDSIGSRLPFVKHVELESTWQVLYRPKERQYLSLRCRGLLYTTEIRRLSRLTRADFVVDIVMPHGNNLLPEVRVLCEGYVKKCFDGIFDGYCLLEFNMDTIKMRPRFGSGGNWTIAGYDYSWGGASNNILPEPEEAEQEDDTTGAASVVLPKRSATGAAKPAANKTKRAATPRDTTKPAAKHGSKQLAGNTVFPKDATQRCEQRSDKPEAHRT